MARNRGNHNKVKKIRVPSGSESGQNDAARPLSYSTNLKHSSGAATINGRAQKPWEMGGQTDSFVESLRFSVLWMNVWGVDEPANPVEIEKTGRRRQRQGGTNSFFGFFRSSPGEAIKSHECVRYGTQNLILISSQYIPFSLRRGHESG